MESRPIRTCARHPIQGIYTIGAVAASTILIERPRTGRLRKLAIASLAGVAPVTRQSGRWRGQLFIHGGRRPARYALPAPSSRPNTIRTPERTMSL
ncbi:MAG: transposase [Marinibacterium sp.]